MARQQLLVDDASIEQEREREQEAVLQVVPKYRGLSA